MSWRNITEDRLYWELQSRFGDVALKHPGIKFKDNYHVDL